MQASQSLIGDLEAAIQVGSQDERIEMMRRVTILFLGGAESFTGEQVALFDGVLARLIVQMESSALAELGAKLAPLAHAPKNVIRTLARHDEIDVAGPVLAKSQVLSDQDLIEIASTKGQGHLGAISERASIATAVTDILVDRGDSGVLHKLSLNRGASFSHTGFTTLTNRAQTDEQLAENLGRRTDLSPQLFRQLVLKATDTVRARLLATAPPDVRDTIQNVLTSVSTKVMEAAAGQRDFKRAEAAIDALKKANLLDEPAIVKFVEAGNYEEMVVGIARLCASPYELIDTLMQTADYKGLLVACKAATLHWPTFHAILKAKPAHLRSAATEAERARADYLRLSTATAQRMIRFWVVRGVAQHQTELAAWTVNERA